jgi:tryptophan halogenase
VSERAVRSICVVGDGIVGLSAALAIGRAFPTIATSILATTGDPSAMTELLPATLPAVGRFHAAIGFDELDLIRRGIAQHHLGTRFGGAQSWIHSFGDVGRPEGAVAFHQLWLRAHREGRALPYQHYSPSSMIGAAGKFVHPSSDASSPLSTYLYGLRFDPRRYRDALDLAASHLPRVSGDLLGIDRGPDGRIAALHLPEDRRLAADLYLDCSGPRAIVHRLIGSPFDDWSKWITTSAATITGTGSSTPDPLDFAEQGANGWSLTATAPGVTTQTMLGRRGASLKPGRLAEPFRHNVLALGDAAVALDPLLGLNLSLAHNAILRAIELMPGRDMNPLELAEYNRRTEREHLRARDARMLLEPSIDELPDTLARTLEQWRARGRLPFFEEELLSPSSWAQLLIGRGILPSAVAPLTGQVDNDAAATAMARYAAGIADLAASIPPYPTYLATMGA